MHIESIFSLEPLLKDKIINCTLQRVAYQVGTVSLESKSLVLSGYGDSIISLYNPAIKRYAHYKVSPKGTTNIGGDLYGFEFSVWDKNNLAENGYKASVISPDQDSTILSVQAYGENDDYEVTDYESLKKWYERSGEIPESVTVVKKTIFLLAFELSTGNWTYLQSRGDKNIRIVLDSSVPPKKFIDKVLNRKLVLVDSIK